MNALMDKMIKVTERKIYRKRRWRRILSVLASVTVFCTVYALIIPAITKETPSYCGYTEHKEHTEACYSEKKTLVCGLSEEGHVHSDGCYEEKTILICDLQESEGHVHDEACKDENGSLICNMEEGDGAHHHGEDCYQVESELICGQEERAPHEHTDACYETEKTLVCDTPIHEHGLQCFSNPEADVETEDQWKKTFSDIVLTGDWAGDAFAIAETQLGYKESTANYAVQEDGVTMKGYTRYGDWYGSKYGDWCAMFCSFCLHYSEIDPDAMPLEASCRKWIEKLSSSERSLYHKAGEYTPKTGDLIFFDWDTYENEEDRISDHVGFVAELISDPETEEVVKIRTLEGNSDNQVQYVTYEIGDSRIMGYGEIPENPERMTCKEAVTDNGIKVSVSAPASSYPYNEEEITLSAHQVTDSAKESLIAEKLEKENAVPADMIMLDVALLHNGEEIEPVGPVEVSFDIGNVIDAVAVYHVDEENQTVTNMEATVNDNEEGTVTIVTDHFSVFALASDNSGKAVTAEVITTWDETNSCFSSIKVETICTNQDNMFFCIEKKSPGEDGWTICKDSNTGTEYWTEQTQKGNEATIDATNWVSSEPVGTAFRVYGSTNKAKPANAGYSKSFTLMDLLEAEKPGFQDWLELKNQNPSTVEALYDAFASYKASTVGISISKLLYAGNVFLSYTATAEGIPDGAVCKWQYQNENGVWQDLGTQDSLVNTEAYSALTGGKTVRCVVLDSSNQPLAVSDHLYVNPADKEVSNKPTITASWDANMKKVSAFTLNGTNPYKGATATLQYSDDGINWTDWNSKQVSQNENYTLNGVDENTDCVNGSSLSREWRVYLYKDDNNNNVTGAVTLFDILESCKSGFNSWLLNEYVQEYDGEHLPENQEELYNAFDLYYGLPELTIQESFTGENLILTAKTSYTGTASYVWEYFDTQLNEWTELSGENGSQLNASKYSELTGSSNPVLDGGKDVRCKLYGADENLLGIAVKEKVDPRAKVYEQAIAAINTGLNLSSYPVAVGTSAATIKNVDIRIHEDKYDNYFYWTNLAEDSRVPFTDGNSYADYLASVYISYEDPKDGLAAVKVIWDRYLYDMYDPINDTDYIDNKTTYPEYTYGDQYPDFIKDKNSTSFHGTKANLPQVNNLNYNYLENGIDYANFITKLDKSAAAEKAGDENTERKYLIDITADAQAKAVGPVAMILQIQTSWQLFDLKHANAQSGEGNTEVGGVANNTELANLYDIKQALLRFVDYMEKKYPGNNLVLGITETRHTASQTMLLGQDSSGNALYVSNDYDILRKSIENWDSFGNCEHVHYDSNTLAQAVQNLTSNLARWEDFYGQPIQYNDIQKTAVIIGGPTENSDSTNGYACTLPWTTFAGSNLNSVYGIRVNEGTPVKGAPVISWIDYAENNKGAAYKDGTGTSFTKKYVATTEDAVFNTLVQIAEKEMLAKSIDIKAQDKYVDDVMVSDTVNDEFLLDPEVPFTATVSNKDGSIAYETVINWQTGEVIRYRYTNGNKDNGTVITGTRTESVDENNQSVVTITFADTQEYPIIVNEIEQTVSYTGPQSLTITKKSDGTTDIQYNFGRAFNTKKCNLHFGIKAQENYIGSNNVYTNEGKPDLEYTHNKVDASGQLTGESDNYSIESQDTPQVNVPIRFTTCDGGQKKVLLNTQVNLGTDEELNSSVITEAVEDLIDNYDQINGTLTYTWVLPDDTQMTCGSIPVQNGSVEKDEDGNPKFPSLEYSYLKNTTDMDTITLQVTFTPETIDSTNPNFKQDNVTNVAVNAKTEPGRVWIEGVDSDKTVSYYVRKEWIGTPATETISFRLSDGNGGFIGKADDGSWILTSSEEYAERFTLSEESDWETRISGLPSVKKEGEEDIILNYTPEELDIPEGYSVSYGTDTRTDTIEEYAATLKVTFTVSGKVDNKHKIKFTYQYHDREETVEKNIETAYVADTKYTIDLSTNAEVNEDNQPYAFTVSDITKAFVVNDNNKKVTITSVSAEPKLISSREETTTVLVITNTKTAQKIRFIKQDFNSNSPLAGAEFALYAADENGEPQAEPLEGYSNLQSDAEGFFPSEGFILPKGIYFLVEKKAPDGYQMMTQPLKLTVADDGITVCGNGISTEPVTAEKDPDTNIYQIVVCNSGGYELPESGGRGIFPYLLGGIALMCMALIGIGKRILTRDSGK